MVMSAPRILRSSGSGKTRMSRPLNRMRPPGWTALPSRRRRIDKAVTDLPDPDSPTRATVSPLWIVKLTRSTASVSRSRERKATDRSWTSSSVSVIEGRAPGPRIGEAEVLIARRDEIGERRLIRRQTALQMPRDIPPQPDPRLLSPRRRAGLGRGGDGNRGAGALPPDRGFGQGARPARAVPDAADLAGKQFSRHGREPGRCAGRRAVHAGNGT